MARRTQAQNRPLLDYPKTKPFSFKEGRISGTIEITVCENLWVKYAITWKDKPPAGITAICEGQVSLKKGSLGKPGDRLGKIRAVADGPFYGGQRTADGRHSQFLHSFQLNDVDDFEFHAKVYEEI